jgi:tetraacyldisaccharide-1-P 4'-kinase
MNSEAKFIILTVQVPLPQGILRKNIDRVPQRKFIMAEKREEKNQKRVSKYKANISNRKYAI